MKYKEPIVVAEVGANHMGDESIARRLIEQATQCGAHVVKFQKRHPKELLTPEQYYAPHPAPWHSYGETYGEHRERLELPISVHRDLATYAKERGILYSSSVWDMTSAREVAREINPPFIKVPSACNNHEALLVYLRDEYEGDIHISLGMTTIEEQQRLRAVFKDQYTRLVLYACTSGYPVPFESAYLLEIERLRSLWHDMGARIGYSGHHLGIAVDIAAYTLGAEYIERHFTLDRTWKGTDHAASLEPHGLEKLVRDLRATQLALRLKPAVMDPLEVEQRSKLKFRERQVT